MDAPWAVWAEIVTPDDIAEDTSTTVLVGMYSTAERAHAAQNRAEADLRPHDSVEWTIVQVQLDAVDWDTGFFDWTKE